MRKNGRYIQFLFLLCWMVRCSVMGVYNTTAVGLFFCWRFLVCSSTIMGYARSRGWLHIREGETLKKRESVVFFFCHVFFVWSAERAENFFFLGYIQQQYFEVHTNKSVVVLWFVESAAAREGGAHEVALLLVVWYLAASKLMIRHAACFGDVPVLAEIQQSRTSSSWVLLKTEDRCRGSLLSAFDK